MPKPIKKPVSEKPVQPQVDPRDKALRIADDVIRAFSSMMRETTDAMCSAYWSVRNEIKNGE